MATEKDDNAVTALLGRIYVDKSLDVRQRLYLLRYYLANFVRAKIGRRLISKRLRKPAPSIERAWAEIRNRVTGQEDWLVVGNGPSLRAADLTALRALPAVASNKINLLFDQTPWRPSLYSMADPLLAYKLPRAHYDTFLCTLTSDDVYYLTRAARKLPFLTHTLDYAYEALESGNLDVSPLHGFWTAMTITIPNIQLAMWAGAKRIYLIGCDHYYKEPPAGDRTVKVLHEGQNHFHPDYRKPGEIVNAAPIDKMNEGYTVMRRFAEAAGVQIINASRVTHLDAFERMPIDDLIAKFNR